MIGEEAVAREIGGKYADVDLVRFRARAAISAHLAALEAAGWKCVPMEATDVMAHAASNTPAMRVVARAYWRCMVAAAPSAQNGQIDEGGLLMPEDKPAQAPAEEATWPDPTPEMLRTPEFEAIWQTIKTWDINVPAAYGGYCGATGNHVRAIMDALDRFAAPMSEADAKRLADIRHAWSDESEEFHALPFMLRLLDAAVAAQRLTAALLDPSEEMVAALLREFGWDSSPADKEAARETLRDVAAAMKREME